MKPSHQIRGGRVKTDAAGAARINEPEPARLRLKSAVASLPVPPYLEMRIRAHVSSLCYFDSFSSRRQE